MEKANYTRHDGMCMAMTIGEFKSCRFWDESDVPTASPCLHAFYRFSSVPSDWECKCKHAIIDALKFRIQQQDTALKASQDRVKQLECCGNCANETEDGACQQVIDENIDFVEDCKEHDNKYWEPASFVNSRLKQPTPPAESEETT